MGYLLGIDIGTTSTKTALFSERGALVDIAVKEYRLYYPRENWVEQYAEDWWEALVHTVREIVNNNRCGREIVGMSLSTQGGALVLLDENFRPVYKAVSWLDSRARETSEQLQQKITKEQLYRMSGWPAVHGLNFPTTFWFKEKQPDIFRKARFFASTVDYVNYRLCGNFVIDHTNLALTEFLDLASKDISDIALQIAGISRENVPRVVQSGKVIGWLKNDVAAQLGIKGKVSVVSGAQDQYCANIGAGAVNIGDCVLSCGTAWVLLATCDKLYFNNESLGGTSFTRAVFPGLHPIENKFGLMTSVPFGGNSLKWYRDEMRPGFTYEQLNMESERTPIGSDNLFFLPISSTKTGRGAFLGIDGVHKLNHFTRAVLEGVAFVNRRHLDLIRESGVAVKNLIMIGGGAKSPVWPKIVSDVCNVPVYIPELSEAACTGAAVLAGFGSGVFSSIEEGCAKTAGEKKEILPEKRNVAVYDALYLKFIESLGAV